MSHREGHLRSTCLKDHLPPSGTSGLQIDKCLYLFGPLVLCDEAVGCLLRTWNYVYREPEVSV